MQGRRGVTCPNGRGFTLVEVLVAMAILFFISVAVLQLFSLSYLVNMGSLARTDLQYRAERVAEGLRYLRVLGNAAPVPWNCGIDMSALSATGPVDIPNDPNDPCWGIAGFRVVESSQNPFILSYRVQDGQSLGAGPVWIITVSARPAAVGPRYLGMAIAAKGVRYVVQVPK